VKTKIKGIKDPLIYLTLDEAEKAAHGQRVPGKVAQIYFDELPPCYFCETEKLTVPARFDFATTLGPWAYGCEYHYLSHRAAPALGEGQGQMLVLAP